MDSRNNIIFKLHRKYLPIDTENHESHVSLLTNIMKRFKNIYPDREHRCTQLDKVDFCNTCFHIMNPDLRIDCGQSILLLLMEYYYQMCSNDSLDNIELKVPNDGVIETNMFFGSLPKKTDIDGDCDCVDSNYPIKIEYIKNNVAYKLKDHITFSNNMGWWTIRLGKFNDIPREFINELWYDGDDASAIPESSDNYVYAFFTGKTKLKYNFSFGFLDTISQKMTTDFEKDIQTQFEFDASYQGAIEGLYRIHKEELGTDSISILSEIERYIPLIKMPETDKEKQIIIANCYSNYASFLMGPPEPDNLYKKADSDSDSD